MSRTISDLHPELQKKIEELMSLCAKNGITIGIAECVRTVAEQNALYAKGRTAPGKVVTNCKGTDYKSMHQWGVAFDFYLKCDANKDGRVNSLDSYYDATGLFAKVGKLGQSIGLEWGGSWTSIIDKPHFQLPQWGSTAKNLIAKYGTPDKFMKTWASTDEDDKKSDTKKQNTAATASKKETSSTAKKGTSTTIKATVSAKSGANVRSRATTDGTKLGAIACGQVVEVVKKDAAKSNGVSWAKIKYKGSDAFTAQSNLDFSDVVETYKKGVVSPAESKSDAYAGTYKTTANLNLRAGASESADILDTIKKGEKVNCYGYYTKKNSTVWYYVQVGKHEGYMSSKYLKKA